MAMKYGNTIPESWTQKEMDDILEPACTDYPSAFFPLAVFHPAWPPTDSNCNVLITIMFCTCFRIDTDNNKMVN